MTKNAILLQNRQLKFELKRERERELNVCKRRFIVVVDSNLKAKLTKIVNYSKITTIYILLSLLKNPT